MKDELVKFDPVTEDIRYHDADYPASMKPVIFFNQGDKIVGTMFIAAGKGPHPTVMLLNGFPGNENNFDLAHAARRAGWNVLVFFYRGTWGSSGTFSWGSCLDDVKTAVEFLESEENSAEYRIDPSRIVLIGHSLGGSAALLTAAENEKIKNAAALAWFNFGKFADYIKNSEELKNESLGRMAASVQLLNSNDEHKLLEEMITCSQIWDLCNYTDILSKKNILLIRGKYDSLSTPDIHYFPFIKKMQNENPQQLIDITLDSGHSFSDSRIKLSRIIINWLKKIEV